MRKVIACALLYLPIIGSVWDNSVQPVLDST